jgi:hypothetical protein
MLDIQLSNSQLSFVFRMTSSWKLTRLSSDPLKGVPFLITNTITTHLTFSRCSEVGDAVAHCGAGFLCVMRCVQTNQLRRAQRTASRKGDYSPRVGDNGFLNSRSRMRMWASGGWGRSEQRRAIISGAHGTGRPGTMYVLFPGETDSSWDEPVLRLFWPSPGTSYGIAWR